MRNIEPAALSIELAIEFAIASGQAMQDFARRFADALLAAQVAQIKSPFVVHLAGTLGAGKTTFCQGVLAGLGYGGRVKSPTYTLVESYMMDLPGIRQVHHFDFYRIHDPQELECMGIRDYFVAGALCLIEWPDKAAGLAGKPDLIVNIALDAEDPGKRQLRLQSSNPEIMLWLRDL